jgi:Recombinase
MVTKALCAVPSRAERAAHRLLLEVDRLREEGVTSRQALARALTERGVPTPRDGQTWTHATVGRLLARASMEPLERRSGNARRHRPDEPHADAMSR